MNGFGSGIATVPLRTYVSIGFTAVAATFTSTWLPVGVGVGSSPTMMLSGGPGCVDVGGFHGGVLLRKNGKDKERGRQGDKEKCE